MGALAAIPAILSVLGPLLEKFIPDANKRTEAQLEIQSKLLDQRSDLYKAMAGVMTADAASESWLTRNARPITIVWALLLITWIGVVSPMLGLQKEVVDALKGVPEDLWSLLSVCLGAYMLARTADKFATNLTGKAGS